MSSFTQDQVVWAKLGTYPHWPGRVAKLKDVKDDDIREQLGSAPTNNTLIFFFGSANYAWVPNNLVSGWDEGYETHSKHKKAKTQKSFLNAIKQAEKFKEKGKMSDDDSDESEKEPEKGKRHKEEQNKKQESKKDKDDDSKKSPKSDTKKKEKSKKEEKKNNESQEDKKKKKDERKKDDRKQTKKEEDKMPKKRKASDDERDHESNKRPKLNEVTPKKETPTNNNNSNSNAKAEEPQNETPMKEKMETDLQSPDSKQSDKMDVVLPIEQGEKKLLGSNVVLKSIVALTRHPVSKYHKLDIVNHGEGHASARAFFSDVRATSKQEVHANLGAAYFLIDMTSYAAVLLQLHEGESAITQDIHITVHAPIPQGAEVKVKAVVTKYKPEAGLFFLDGEVWQNKKLLVTARIVKSVLEPDLPVKEAKDSTNSGAEEKKEKL